jgi:RNA polymerase sigma factor (sigma-70 family)
MIRSASPSRRTYARPGDSPTLDRMDGERSDEALMLAWAAGEAEAFEPLYARHRAPLFRFLLRQVRVQATAEELFQDVWQRVVASRKRYRPDARFATWLYQVASNRLTDHWRAASHRPSATDEDTARLEREADPGSPDHALSVFEERRRLQRALEDLPPEQREALLLRLEQELSLEEIAAITGAGRETVKSRLRYAMDKLKARLSRTGELDAPAAKGSNR